MYISQSRPARSLGWPSTLAALVLAVATIVLSVGATMATTSSGIAFISAVGWVEIVIGGAIAILVSIGISYSRRQSDMSLQKVIPVTIGAVLLWYLGYLLIPSTW